MATSGPEIRALVVAGALVGLLATSAAGGDATVVLRRADAVPHTQEEHEHVKQVEEWREKREASLREPDSWLFLVGLDWLREGRNSVGSDPEADVRLPVKAPAAVGWIEWEGTDLRFVPADARVTVDGSPVAEAIPLVRDSDGEPTERRKPALLRHRS